MRHRFKLASGLAAAGALAAAPAAFADEHVNVSIHHFTCNAATVFVGRDQTSDPDLQYTVTIDNVKIDQQSTSFAGSRFRLRIPVAVPRDAARHQVWVGVKVSQDGQVIGEGGNLAYLTCSPLKPPPKPPRRHHHPPRVCRPAVVSVHHHVIRASRAVTVLTDTGGVVHARRVRVPKGAHVATVLRGCGRSRTVTWGPPRKGKG